LCTRLVAGAARPPGLYAAQRGGMGRLGLSGFLIAFSGTYLIAVTGNFGFLAPVFEIEREDCDEDHIFVACPYNVAVMRSRVREAAWRQFVKALINAAAAGLRPHCTNPDTSFMWISEDAADRQEASLNCAGCPVIAECYAVGQYEGFGVWGGYDRSPRARTGRPPTHRPVVNAAA
jgi:hypothetical protein